MTETQLNDITIADLTELLETVHLLYLDHREPSLYRMLSIVTAALNAAHTERSALRSVAA